MAVAAPTAGLHLGDDALAAIEARGAHLARVRLEVGHGTFAPIRSETIEEHHLDFEDFVVPEATAAAVDRARRDGGRVIAVGTTVVRTLESVAIGEGGFAPAPARPISSFAPGSSFTSPTRSSPTFTCRNRVCWYWWPPSRGANGSSISMGKPCARDTVSIPMATRPYSFSRSLKSHSAHARIFLEISSLACPRRSFSLRLGPAASILPRISRAWARSTFSATC